VSYANQKGVKQQPPATDLNYSQLKYWDWPIWDKETFSVTGQKNFENSYLKALAYYDTSTSSLFAYDSATFATMSKASSFKSRYQDHSVGARLEYGIALGDNFVKAAANYKKDVHEGYDLNKVTEAKTLTETYEDHTITLGLEDSYKISSHWELLGGVSYDTRTADKIFDTNTANLDMLDLKTQSSFSPEAALIYSPDESSKVRGSISRKTYMPSMKDRYSRKFNKYVPNVDLKNELSTHYELSYQKQLNAFVGQTNLFYTKVDDAIQSVSWNQNPALLQNQNVGTFEHKGIELELSYKQDGLEVGGNYTHIAIENRSDSAVKIVDVPKNQIFVYAQKEVGAGFSLYANAKYRNGAYELNNKNDFNAANDTYDINPDFTTFDVKAIYEPTKAITAEIGIKNLTDELVKYDMAFPMAGREFFANLEYKF
jgi:iron complex outermembrane receptor protein